MQAARADALQQLRASLSALPRKQDHKLPLGHLWQVLPPLLCSNFPRISSAAADTLATLGAAIYVATGALVPPAAPAADRGAAAPPRGRGARRKGRPDAAANAQTAANWPDGDGEPVPATAVVTWAEGVLAGGPGPGPDGAPASEDERARVHTVLTGLVSEGVGAARPALAGHVLRSVQRLLEASATTAAQLPAYLEVLLAAVQAAPPVDTGRLLPDLVDVFLGWALDPACSQPARCAAHQHL